MGSIMRTSLGRNKTLNRHFFHLLFPSNIDVNNRFYVDHKPRLTNFVKIKATFECSKKEVSSLVKQCTALQNKDIESTLELVEDLKKKGLKPTTIMGNIQLLEVPGGALRERVDLLLRFGYRDLNLYVHLLNSELSSIKSYHEVTKICRRKVTEFSEMMDCSLVEACEDFKKHKFLKASKMSTLKAKIDVINEGGVPKSELRKDLWVLSYTLGKLEERLQELKKMRLLPLKPWMFRCDEDTIKRAWLHREENRIALSPYASTEEYLCERLNMTEDQIRLFAAKHPPVMRVQVSKLRDMIDFLLSEGITTVQIYHTPRILCHSMSTILNRLNSLREKKYEPHSLSILCRSRRVFEDFLNKLTPQTQS